MIDVEQAYEILSGVPTVVEVPHFDKPAYKIHGKIFATFNIENKWVTLKFTPEQQTIWCEDPSFYPVPTKWGQYGWTHVDLNRVKKAAFIEAIETACRNIIAEKPNRKRK